MNCRSPYRIEEPAQLCFSGGTSAFNHYRNKGIDMKNTAHEVQESHQDNTAQSDLIALVAASKAARKAAVEAGLPALRTLLTVARSDTGQSRVIAGFLLSLYNGYRFNFDLTDFRAIDADLFEQCMLVLRMDSQPMQEVHKYFTNGGEIFEQLAKNWNVPDRMKLRVLISDCIPATGDVALRKKYLESNSI